MKENYRPWGDVSELPSLTVFQWRVEEPLRSSVESQRVQIMLGSLGSRAATEAIHYCALVLELYTKELSVCHATDLSWNQGTVVADFFRRGT